MIEDSIVELRLQADAIVYNLENDLARSAEITKASNSLKMAKAWLGKLLGLMGRETPYKNDGNRHKRSDIEPAADTVKRGLPLGDRNQVERVDYLREKLAELQKTYDALCESHDSTHISVSTALVSVLQHFAEARFWLGFELGRLRDSS